MGQLRSWFDDEMADNLGLKVEDEEDEETEGALPRPISDDTILTTENISQDGVEDYGWIKHAMFEELPRSVLSLGAPPSYRSGLDLKAEKLAEFERLMRGEGIEIIRNDELIALIKPAELAVEGVEEAARTIKSLVG